MTMSVSKISRAVVLAVTAVGFLMMNNSMGIVQAQGKVYKIGDKGPAGGWVFYDKGDNSNGWRYLEAAPKDSGSGKWGCTNKSIPGAQGVKPGTGKANTRAIVKGCGESNTAAKIAAAYRGGGKNDWYLPSKDELNLIYTNLFKKSIGDISSPMYWSSSEISAKEAWLQSFFEGEQLKNDKSEDAGGIRAIRAFQ